MKNKPAITSEDAIKRIRQYLFTEETNADKDVFIKIFVNGYEYYIEDAEIILWVDKSDLPHWDISLTGIFAREDTPYAMRYRCQVLMRNDEILKIIGNLEKEKV